MAQVVEVNESSLWTSGETLTLVDVISRRKFSFNVEFLDKKKSQHSLYCEARVLLHPLTVDSNSQQMHLMEDGSVEFRHSPPNRNNILTFTPSSSDHAVFIHTTRTSASLANCNYLICHSNGSLACWSTSEPPSNGRFHVVRGPTEEDSTSLSISSPTQPFMSSAPALPLKTPLLSRWQVRRFAMEGYLQVPALIPLSVVSEVRRLLHCQLGQVGSLVAGGIQGGSFGKFGGEMSTHPKIRSLVTKTSLKDILEAAFLGAPIHQLSNLSAQIAFRFPEMPSSSSSSTASRDIDWHTDGARQGHFHPFSLLVGIALNDVSVLGGAGNLVVWPSSHWLLHKCKHQPNGAIDNDAMHRFKDSRPDFYDFPHVSQPIRVSAGDVVILHSDLAHAGDVNLSDTTREMIYFRIKPRYGESGDQFSSWEEVGQAQQKDIWAGLRALQSTLGAELEALTNLYSPAP